jgi:hypothetical protein
MSHFEAGGIHHFGEEQGVRSPSSNQATKYPVAYPRKRRLQNTAPQLTCDSMAGELQG